MPLKKFNDLPAMYVHFIAVIPKPHVYNVFEKFLSYFSSFWCKIVPFS